MCFTLMNYEVNTRLLLRIFYLGMCRKVPVLSGISKDEFHTFLYFQIAKKWSNITHYFQNCFKMFNIYFYKMPN